MYFEMFIMCVHYALKGCEGSFILYLPLTLPLLLPLPLPSSKQYWYASSYDIQTSTVNMNKSKAISAHHTPFHSISTYNFPLYTMRVYIQLVFAGCH